MALLESNARTCYLASNIFNAGLSFNSDKKREFQKIGSFLTASFLASGIIPLEIVDMICASVSISAYLKKNI